MFRFCSLKFCFEFFCSAGQPLDFFAVVGVDSLNDRFALTAEFIQLISKITVFNKEFVFLIAEFVIHHLSRLNFLVTLSDLYFQLLVFVLIHLVSGCQIADFGFQLSDFGFQLSDRCAFDIDILNDFFSLRLVQFGEKRKLCNSKMLNQFNIFNFCNVCIFVSHMTFDTNFFFAVFLEILIIQLFIKLIITHFFQSFADFIKRLLSDLSMSLYMLIQLYSFGIVSR